MEKYSSWTLIKDGLTLEIPDQEDVKEKFN